MNIYIHIPFCHRKCHYCYYYSFVPCQKQEVDDYLNFLEIEFALKGKKFNFGKKTKIKTIYIGGGTPNYLSEGQMERLFYILKKYLNLDSVREFIMELNPANCTFRQLKFIKKQGVTRLSFGIQTLNPKILEKINRQHVFDNFSIIKMAQKLGFLINLDFILGLPGQKIEDIIENIDFVKKVSPNSSFWCELRIGTEEIRKHQDFSSRKNRIKMYELVRKSLVESGYNQLIPEYFSFEKKLPIFLNEWWISKKSIGLGLSAFSKVGKTFYKNTDSLEKYKKFMKEQKLPLAYLYQMSKKEEAILYLISELKKGKADLGEIRKKFKVDLKKMLYQKIKELVKKRSIILKENKIALSPKEFTLSSSVDVRLLKDWTYFGRLKDTAFNFLNNLPNLEVFFRKNFLILNDKGDKMVFASPDKKGVGILNKN